MTTPALIDLPASPTAPSAAGVFSARVFRERRPAAYDRIVALLAENTPVRTIIQIIRDEMPAANGDAVSGHIVLAIKRERSREIATIKATLAAQALDNAELAGAELQRRLVECPTALETSDLVRLHGASVEKGLLLAGEATERLDVQVGADPSLMFAAYLAALTGGSAEKERAPGVVIEVQAESVPTAGDGDHVPTVPTVPQTDIESAASATKHK